MRKNLLFLALAVIAGIVMFNTAVLAAAKPDRQIVGKQGWITLKSETKVGDHALPAGIYYFSHEVRDGSHFMAFQQVGDPDIALQYSDEGTVGPVIRVECRMETLPARVKKTDATSVPDGTERRITRIEIKGENVAHEF